MLPYMLRSRHHFKVFDPVVPSISILVMDYLVSAQGSAKVRRHYDAML